MTKKQKIIISVCIPVAVVLIVTAILLLVFLLKPTRAGTVEVIAGDYQICVQTSVKQEKRTYRFKFVSSSSTKEFDSQSHTLDITQLLWSGQLELGTEYHVSASLVEPSGVLAGDYGESTTFTPTLRLKPPVVEYDAQSSVISWQAVEHADGYNICYQDGEIREVIYQTDLSFNLSRIKGGERRNVYVTATSEKSGVLESDNSSETTLSDHHHNIEPILAAYIDSDKNIVVESRERYDTLIVEFGGERCEVSTFIVTKTGSTYRLKFSIKSIYSPQKTYLLTPKGDEYNHFLGHPFEVQKG